MEVGKDSDRKLLDLSTHRIVVLASSLRASWEAEGVCWTTESRTSIPRLHPDGVGRAIHSKASSWRCAPRHQEVTWYEATPYYTIPAHSKQAARLNGRLWSSRLEWCN